MSCLRPTQRVTLSWVQGKKRGPKRPLTRNQLTQQTQTHTSLSSNPRWSQSSSAPGTCYRGTPELNSKEFFSHFHPGQYSGWRTLINQISENLSNLKVNCPPMRGHICSVQSTQGITKMAQAWTQPSEEGAVQGRRWEGMEPIQTLGRKWPEP